MILVGRYQSPFVRRVAISLKLLGIPFENKSISTINDRPGVTAHNPLGRVPALVVDDSETLIESGFILDYLDEIVGPERALVPAKGAARRHVLRLVALGLGVMEKTIALYTEKTRRPPEAFHPPIFEQCRNQARDGLMALERLAGSPWLAGDRLSQADVTLAAGISFMKIVAPETLDGLALPKIEAALARAEALPAFAETRPPT